MISAPFSLNWGDEVYAKVLATNLVGSSGYSPETTSPGVLLTGPDSPANLANYPAFTNANQIGLVWDDGANDGGS